jgi:tetratricopeptide (TPR) repeat protein
MDVRKLISDSCRDFKKDFGIIHKIEEFVFWTPEVNPASMHSHLNDLSRKVHKESNDIVIGIISNDRTKDITAGLASYLHGYIILKNFKSKTAMTSVLKHEVCHMYGAVDIHEKDSIMNIENLGCEFDEFTRDIILLNKHREFDPNAYPLPESCMDEAIKLYKKRAELNLGEPELHLVLASLYLEKQEPNLALAQCLTAIELKPELTGIHILIGNIHLKMGEAAMALNAYRRASQIFPQLPEIQFNMGLAYTHMGKIEDAISAYCRTIELNPLYFDAYANLGHLYLIKDEPGLAITSSQKATSLRPGFPNTHNILGVALALSGDSKNAEMELKRACELRPDYLEAHFNLGVLYLQNQRLQESAAYFSRAIALDSDFVLGYQKLTEVYYALFQEYKKEAEKRRINGENSLFKDFLFTRTKLDH